MCQSNIKIILFQRYNTVKRCWNWTIKTLKLYYWSSISVFDRSFDLFYWRSSFQVIYHVVNSTISSFALEDFFYLVENNNAAVFILHLLLNGNFVLYWQSFQKKNIIVILNKSCFYYEKIFPQRNQSWYLYIYIYIYIYI